MAGRAGASPGGQLRMDGGILCQVEAQRHDAAVVQERLHLPAVLQQQAEQLQRLGQPAQHLQQLGLRRLVRRRLLGQPVAVAASARETAPGGGWVSIRQQQRERGRVHK